MRRLLLCLAAAAGLASTASGQPVTRATPSSASSVPNGTLQVSGDAGRSATLTLADLAALPRETVKGPTGHGGPSKTFEGARLVDVLRGVGAPLGARLHGPAAAMLVVFTGSDGYRSVMALADADPDTHPPARIIVADKADGQPLDAKEGPLRLIIEKDLRPTRSVHNLVKVELKSLP